MKKLLLLLLFSAQIFTSCGQNIPAEITEEEIIWDYPEIDLGKIDNYEERWVALQIPEDTLKRLSSRNLAEICVYHPMLWDYIFFDYPRGYIMRMITRDFNGLKELSERQDGVKELVNVYREYPAMKYYETTHDLLQNLLRLQFIELLLCDDLFFNRLNDTELAKLGKIVLNSCEYKKQNFQNTWLHGCEGGRRGGADLSISLLLGSLILNKLQGQTENTETLWEFIKYFYRRECELTSKTADIIYSNL